MPVSAVTHAPPARANRALASDPPPNILSDLGYWVMLLYLFFSYSRILDVTVPSLHIPLLLGILLYGITVMSGGVAKGVRTTQGKLLLVLTALMVASIPFSVWRGASVEVLTDKWMKAFPFFFITVAFADTSARSLTLLRTLAISISTLSLIAIARGETDMGRLIIAGSRFGNPNDLAAVCILALPIWILVMSISRGMLMRWVGIGGMAITMVAMLKTGSRGAMIAIVVAGAYLFFKLPVTKKIIMVGAVAVAVLVAAATLPREVTIRYALLFSGESRDDNSREADAAEGSSESRLLLLKNAIILTLKNPVFGVGPGNFAVAENELMKGYGFRKGQWHVTHNMYADMSSEVGIPAFLCFVGVIVASFRQTGKLMKYRGPEESFFQTSGFWLRVSMIAFCTAGFFQSIAYQDTLPMLAGVVVALTQSSERSFRTQKAQVPAAPPLPRFGRRPRPDIAAPAARLSPG